MTERQKLEGEVGFSPRKAVVLHAQKETLKPAIPKILLLFDGIMPLFSN